MQEGIISLMQMAKTVRSSKKIKWSRATFYLRINRSNNRRRYSKFCKFRRYYHSRAKSINWICRTKGNRTNSKTKITRRFSKCRILIRTWFYWHDCRKKRLKKCIRKAFDISWGYLSKVLVLFKLSILLHLTLVLQLSHCIRESAL